MPDSRTLRLDGASLKLGDLCKAARENWQVELDPDGLAAMERSHAMVAKAIRDKVPVYGVTTGLGARATELLDAKSLENFSIQTLRGRAHAIGPAISAEKTRTGLIIRLNSMLTGHSAASPNVAHHITACLNAGLTPVVGKIGSIGAADLVINATIANVFLGEGNMLDSNGDVSSAKAVMLAHGIAPLKLSQRDGLALANHSSMSAGLAATAFYKACCAFDAVQTSAAMSLEGFMANLSPVSERAIAIKPHPGHIEVAEDLLTRLVGSSLLEPGQARRLQDPLSFRNIAQIHGTARTALDNALACLQVEINSVSDNPVAFEEANEFVSCGAFFSSELTSVLETISRAFVSIAMAQLARISKLLNPEFSDLPKFLALKESSSNGFAPLMKVAEALVMEISHNAQPVQTWPSINANGVEDCLTGTFTAAEALDKVADGLMSLTAIELLVACQAIELRETAESLGSFLAEKREKIRGVSPSLSEDRPLSEDVQLLVALINQEEFSGGSILA